MAIVFGRVSIRKLFRARTPHRKRHSCSSAEIEISLSGEKLPTPLTMRGKRTETGHAASAAGAVNVRMLTVDYLVAPSAYCIVPIAHCVLSIAYD